MPEGTLQISKFNLQTREQNHWDLFEIAKWVNGRTEARTHIFQFLPINRKIKFRFYFFSQEEGFKESSDVLYVPVTSFTLIILVESEKCSHVDIWWVSSKIFYFSVVVLTWLHGYTAIMYHTIMMWQKKTSHFSLTSENT